MPGSVPQGKSHRVEAGLHHCWLGLQPRQIAADEAAQDGNIRVRGTRGNLIPLLWVNGAAMVVAHLEDNWSGWAGHGIPPTFSCALLTFIRPGYSMEGSP